MDPKVVKRFEVDRLNFVLVAYGWELWSELYDDTGATLVIRRTLSGEYLKALASIGPSVGVE